MLTISKIPFSSKLFISLHCDSVNASRVRFIKLLVLPWINTEMSTMFCQNRASSRRVCSAFRRVCSLLCSMPCPLLRSMPWSLFCSMSCPLLCSVAGCSSLGYRYSFTIVVLKLVDLLGSCTLQVSLSIPSNLNRLVYLLLCPVLPLCYIRTSELIKRL